MKIFANLLASGCSVIALASPAFAQATNPAAPQAGSVVSAADENMAEELIVTGSRVIRNGNDSPTPLTVVTTDQLVQVNPSNIADGLNVLPVFASSNSQRTLNNASRNTTGNYLNLRGLGDLRTLVLLDGRRVPATTDGGNVDINTLPQLLIQRVDVVTGGASAVYCADAVAGVVNFIVDKKFTGVKGVLQGGISGFGDNESQRAGVAFGANLFKGRGHFMASYEFFNSAGIDDKELRPYGEQVFSYSGLGTVASPFTLVNNSRNITASNGGVILNGPLARQQFTTNGVLSPFQNGAPTTSPTLQSGGDGFFWKNSSLLASLRTHQGYARFDYDLADNLQFYTQATAAQSENFNNFITSNWATQLYTISAENGFLSDSVRAALGKTPSFTFGKVFNERDPVANATRVRSFFVNPGMTGTLGDNLRFDVAYSYGQSKSRTANINNPNTQRTSAALDAVKAPNGEVVCRVTLTNPGLYPGCLPLNPFGPTADDINAWRYIQDETFFNATNSQHDVTGSIAGSFFDTWAGPVQMAVSGEYRRLTLDVVSSAQPLDRPNCTGLRFNCNSVSGSVNQSNIIANASANQSITEGAFEVDLPLLADVKFFKALNLNGAVRYTNYTTVGNATTWKVGVNWVVSDELRLRGTRSRDVRAPTLNDLFAPLNESPFGFTDLLTNVNGTATRREFGNPDLTPEIADTLTLGGVYTPAWLPGFAVSVDYYKISIKDAITPINGAAVNIQQICIASKGVDPLCDLYIRPFPFSNTTPANYPTAVLSQPRNAAIVDAYGIDIEANYSTPLFGGRFNIRTLATHQPELITIPFLGAVPQNQGGANGRPAWKITGILHYDIDGFAIDTQTRWRNAVNRSANPTQVFADGKLPAVSFTDVTVSYSIKHGNSSAQFFLTAQNVFDKVAPLAAGPGAIGFGFPVAQGDDVVGRYMTAGVRFNF
jgi:outer membrane receptor protein involved in Fe transport